MLHAKLGERIDHRIDHRAQRRRGAAFTSRAYAQRVRGARYFADDGIEERKIIGAWHGVVHERSGQRLAARGVVVALLHQRLARTLHDAAMHLAVNNHRVDCFAHIINGGILHHFQRAQRGVDLHLAHVAAIGEACVVKCLVGESGERPT